MMIVAAFIMVFFCKKNRTFSLLYVKSALKLVTFWCKSVVLSRIYYNFVTILGLPKNCPTFGHSVHTARAINARRLVCRCPRLGPRVPKAWSQSALDGQDNLVVSDKSSPLTFLTIWVAYILEMPQLLITSIGVV